MPKVFYTGERYKVIFTDLAQETFKQLSQDVQPGSLFLALVARIKKYADAGVLHSPEQLNNEGNGFFAIKSRGASLRAYFWYCQKERSVIVCSHLTMKKTAKLTPQDKATMEHERDNY